MSSSASRGAGSSGRGPAQPASKSAGARKKQPVTSKALVPTGSRAVAPKRSQGLQPARIKKETILAPKGYTMRPIVPAKNKDVVSMARAMNGDFAPRLKKLFDPEREAAIAAQKTGVYIGFRCPDFKWDCQRVGVMSRCFCGHSLGEHASYNGRSIKVPCRGGCPCKAFAWVPSRPEDIGEFWFQRRRDFDVTTWRCKCRCKHTHEEHDPNGMHRCKNRGCSCPAFDSNFLCAACDKHWELHETFFETADERHRNGLPVGEEYLPFHELPELRNIVLTGEEDDDSQYLALTQGEGSIPYNPRPVGNDAVVKFSGRGGFRPTYD